MAIVNIVMIQGHITAQQSYDAEFNSMSCKIMLVMLGVVVEYRFSMKVELCVGKEENGLNNSNSRENF